MKDFLTSKEAAEMLGYKPQTMQLSRHTGVLCGVEAPKFKKLGRTVRYSRKDVLEWVAQFPEMTKIQSEGE